MECKGDIILAIKNSHELNVYEKVDCLKDLFYTTTDIDFKIAADEVVEKMEICPECYSNVITRLQSDFLGESDGYPIYSYLYKRFCPQCGWRED